MNIVMYCNMESMEVEVLYVVEPSSPIVLLLYFVYS